MVSHFHKFYIFLNRKSDMQIKKFLLFFLTSVSVLAQDSIPEKRAIWVVRDALNNPDELEKIVRTAASAAISDIYVQVRALGRSYYLSDIEPRASFISTSYDPLDLLIKIGENYNIRIHAWVNMFYIWSGDQPPLEDKHPFNRYPQYILAKERLPDYRVLKKSGIEGYFLDPQSIEIQKYLLNVLLEIADKYAISGIHLDYFRYPDVEYSFTADSRTNFRLAHFIDPLKLYGDSEYFVNSYGHAVFQQVDKEYRQFLQEALSGYLSEINKILKEKKNGLELSVAVKPDPVVAKYRYFQDWQNWIRDRSCDYVVLMNYRTEWNEFLSVLNQIKDTPEREKIIMGISTYNQNEEAVQKRLKAVRQAGFGGFALFSYNHLADHKDYFYNLQLLDFRGDKNGN
jgi:uncharacterized lipoprotein YddW (UPF0748 family)